MPASKRPPTVETSSDEPSNAPLAERLRKSDPGITSGPILDRWVALYRVARVDSPYAVELGERASERHFKGVLTAASTDLFTQNFVDAFFRIANQKLNIDEKTASNSMAMEPVKENDLVRCAAMAVVFGEDPHHWLETLAEIDNRVTPVVRNTAVRNALDYLKQWLRTRFAVPIIPNEFPSARQLLKRFEVSTLSRSNLVRLRWSLLVARAFEQSPLAQELQTTGSIVRSFVSALIGAAPKLFSADFVSMFFHAPAQFSDKQISELDVQRIAGMAAIFGEDPAVWLHRALEGLEDWDQSRIARVTASTLASMRTWLKVSAESAQSVVTDAGAFGRMKTLGEAPYSLEQIVREVCPDIDDASEGENVWRRRVAILTRSRFYEDPEWNSAQADWSWRTSMSLTQLGVDYFFVALPSDNGPKPGMRLNNVKDELKRRRVSRADHYHFIEVADDSAHEKLLVNWLGRDSTQLTNRLLIVDGRGSFQGDRDPSTQIQILSSFLTPHPYTGRDTMAFFTLPATQQKRIADCFDRLIAEYEASRTK